MIDTPSSNAIGGAPFGVPAERNVSSSLVLVAVNLYYWSIYGTKPIIMFETVFIVAEESLPIRTFNESVVGPWVDCRCDPAQ